MDIKVTANRPNIQEELKSINNELGSGKFNNDAPITIQAWLLIAALIIGALNVRTGINSVSPLIETIRIDLGIGSFGISFLTAIPVFCMGLFAPLASKLSNRYGIEQTVAVCLAIIGFSLAARAFAGDATLLMGTALLYGIGIAVIGPLLSGFVKAHFIKQSTLMIGVLSFSISASSMISTAATPLFVTWFDNSWLLALATWALLSVLALFIWIPVVMKTKKMEAQKVTTSSNISNLEQAGRLPFKNKRAWLIMFYYGIQSAQFYTFISWFGPLAQERGYSVWMAALILTIFSIIQLVVTIFVPFGVRKSRSLQPWILGTSVLLAIGFFIVFLFDGQISIWVSMIILAICLSSMFYLSLLLPLEETTNAKDTSAWTAFMLCGGYLIAGFGPTMSGWIRDEFGSLEYSFALQGVLCIGLVLIGVLLGNKPRQQME